VDIDDLVAGVGLLLRGFGRVAVWLWFWGAQPDVAYERGSYGDRTVVGQVYRRVWRAGQYIGWTLVALIVVAVLVRVYR
jgi:hypothetical protein